MERQVGGHESWFSAEQIILVSGVFGDGGGFAWIPILLYPFLPYRVRASQLNAS